MPFWQNHDGMRFCSEGSRVVVKTQHRLLRITQFLHFCLRVVDGRKQNHTPTFSCGFPQFLTFSWRAFWALLAFTAVFIFRRSSFAKADERSSGSRTFTIVILLCKITIVNVICYVKLRSSFYIAKVQELLLWRSSTFTALRKSAPRRLVLEPAATRREKDVSS